MVRATLAESVSSAPQKSRCGEPQAKRKPQRTKKNHSTYARGPRGTSSAGCGAADGAELSGGGMRGRSLEGGADVYPKPVQHTSTDGDAASAPRPPASPLTGREA